eukprot:scaffold87882_cov19-Prasinocladus_malaysianus.AAC.1
MDLPKSSLPKRGAKREIVTACRVFRFITIILSLFPAASGRVALSGRHSGHVLQADSSRWTTTLLYKTLPPTGRCLSLSSGGLHLNVHDKLINGSDLKLMLTTQRKQLMVARSPNTPACLGGPDLPRRT